MQRWCSSTHPISILPTEQPSTEGLNPQACSPDDAAVLVAAAASEPDSFAAEDARGVTSCRRMNQLNPTPSSASTAPVMGQNQWNAWGSVKGGGGKTLR